MRRFSRGEGGCAVALGALFALNVSGAIAADIPMATKAPAQTAALPAWTYSINTEVQYYSWSSGFGFPTVADPSFGQPGKGTQIYVPTAVSASGLVATDTKLDLVARFGTVSSHQTTPGQTGDFAGTTDSQLSSTLTYSGINGIQPYAALLLNLPTGSSALYGASRFARMDPDLVALSSFGEGFNVGPTFGVNIPINETLLASLSGGYTFRGSFNKEGALDPDTLLQPTDRAKPGDSATVTGSLGYTLGAVAAQGSVSYSWDTASQVNGLVQYRSGQRITVTGSGSYAWSDQWRSSINGFWTHGERNDQVNAAFNLVPEPLDSNSNVYRINMDTTYTFANGFAIGPTASYLNRDRNAYDPFTFTFVPAKTRYSAGGAGSYAMGSFNLTGRLERIWTREKENPANGFPAINSDGWYTSVGGTVSF